MKKRILSIMLAFGMLAAFMPCIASAEMYGDLEYGVNYDGDGVSIYEYTDDESDVVIPSEIDGIPVTCITVGAFKGCTSLTDITIPGSVVNIMNEAFKDCTSLKEVILSDGVAYIHDGAFAGCESLTDITIPASVRKIYVDAFDGCNSITNVTIGCEAGFHVGGEDR